jgi:hypothetical protein
MSQFLTVKEAAQRTGKSPSSIRRAIYPIIQDDQHVDRAFVQPSPEEALQLRVKGENFAWRISEELIAREFPPETAHTASSSTSRAAGSEEGSELLLMLRAELDIKNRQITQQGELIGRQMELISGLSERLREGNVLIATLQRQLAPGEPQRPSTNTVDAKTTSDATGPGPPKTSKSKKKKGFFARMWR